MSTTYGMPIYGKVLDENPIVSIAQGRVMGFTRDKIAIFKGIPYAGNCSGKNRFLPPVDPEAWDGIRDCTRNAAYAPQSGVSIGGDPGELAAYYKGKDPSSTGEIEQQGEDCLFLDVLTPGLDDKKRPVVFYIHGGGFMTGSGTMVAAGDTWCREEDVVIVGVNHRLNFLGYLYLGKYSEKYRGSGSVGMMDLVKALEWVRDNIARFGGDPDNVTLMGESGGGMKVTHLMMMESAKGLYHKAIVESGSGKAGAFSIERAAKVTEQVLKNLGIEEENWEKILEVPVNELLAAGKTITPDNVMPIADNVNIRDMTGTGFVYGDAAYSADVPLLVGASEDEGGLGVKPDTAMTWEEAAERLTRDGFRDIFSRREIDKDQAEAAVCFFREHNPKHDSPFHMLIKINSLFGVLSTGAYAHAMERAAKTEFTAPVYLYMNAYDSAHPFDTRYAFSFHTCDLPLQMRIVQRDQDDWISRIMAHAWAAFARTGDPSTENYPWPAFTPNQRATMIFDNNGMSRVENDPYREYRKVLLE